MPRAALILCVLASVTLLAQPADSGEPNGTPVLSQPDELTWSPIEGGGEIAVLYGDPSKGAPFIARLKFPAGYEGITHSHPTDEFITLLSGKARMAFGEDAEEASAKPWVPGSLMSLPAGSSHHFWVDEEIVAEVHMVGPYSYIATPLKK